MFRYFTVFVLAGCLLAAPQVAKAIPPPDLIANMGSQFVQIFSLFIVLFSAGAGVFIQHFKRALAKLRAKKVVVAVMAAVVVGISLVVAYTVESYRKANVYKAYEVEVTTSIDAGIALNDALNEENLAVAIDYSKSEDSNIGFIAEYYQNLGSGQLWNAYAVSKKSVSFATYSSWYEGVTKTEIESIEKIEDNQYSVQVKLFEGTAVTSYGVLMTLGNGKIVDSTVRILAVDEASSFAPDAVAEGSFFEANKDLPILITNDDFEQARRSSVFVLDGREDEEYDLGHYGGSTHVRFADLIAGSWVSLPTDQVVYVLCWSGIRGKALAEFLRSKGIVARYLEDGANGWVKAGGAWEGEILFVTKYSETRYTGTLSTATVRDLVSKGAVLVDSRQKEKFAESSIPGSVNIPVFFTPSNELNELLASIPVGASVITICDDYVSCFDAKIAGVKLEKLGHTFFGRYTAPSEY